MANDRIFSSYPLFVKDPSFSLWSDREILNEGNARTWFGGEKRVYGFVKTAGKTYCFLGNAADFAACGVEKAEQRALSVTAFTTDYEFRAGNVTLKLRFVSPLPPEDVQLLSLPACYMEYEISGGDAELSLFVNRNLAYNDGNQNNGVRGAVVSLEGFETAFLGLKRQLPFSNNDDKIGADWGYWHVAGERAYFLDERDLCAYLTGGLKEFACVGEERYVGAVNSAKKSVLLLGYDEGFAIDYFGSARKGLYLQDHTIFEALATVWTSYREIDKQLAAFDERLQEKAKPFGKEYLNVLYASLRQGVAAHKTVSDEEGNLLFLSKECGSNGCIATVDVSYPSMPLFLLYNTELVKGMMRPILKFAQMPVWQYDFAPHDAGTYPACCGQVYGLNEAQNAKFVKKGEPETHYPIYQLPASFAVFDLKYQMPVEECANMLVMFYACYRMDGDLSFFEKYRSLAAKWVEYLVKFGLKPEDQLCTDDFAGHLKNNLNLAIKATVGIAAYAELLKAAGGSAEKYRSTAEKFANEITAFGKKFAHLPLTWDADDGTFSLKYNLAFDKIYGLGLFGQDLREKEVDCYLQRANRYGVPLDSRETYSKSDWLMWAASLTDEKEKQQKLIAMLDRYMKESRDRIPFGDWYKTDSGDYLNFVARSVQGGCFILLLPLVKEK